MGKEAWRGLAIMSVAVIVAYIVLAWRPLTAGLGSHHLYAVAGAAFDPSTSCDLPYKTDRIAELCLEAKSSSATVWAALLSLIGIGVSAFVAWKSYQAAKFSAEIADRSWVAERAWLLCKAAQFEIIADVDDDLNIKGAKCEFSITWKNFGQRPAVAVIPTYGMATPKEGQLPNFGNAPTVPPMSDYSTLGPGEEERVVPIPNTYGSIGVFFQEDRQVYVLSSISYSDVLDRFTRYEEHAVFRLKVDPPKQPGHQNLKVWAEDVIIRDGKLLGVWYELPNNGIDSRIRHYRSPTADK